MTSTKNRHVRGSRVNRACMEALESRALLSGSHFGAFAHAGFDGRDNGLHLGWFKNGHTEPTPTAITNLTGNPLTFSEVAGLPGVRTSALPAVQDIATITSTEIPPKLNGYTVSIDWGDGTTTRGLLKADSAGLIHVKGFHAYQAAGTFSVTITVTQTKPAPAAGATAPTLVIVSTANVTQNSATGVTVTPTTGQAFSGAVGTFTIPTTDTTTDPTTFTAYINWGDHSSPRFSLGTVTLNSDGSYTVSDDHTYATAGTYRISVLVLQTVPAAAATANTANNHAGLCSHSLPTFIGAIFSTATVTDAATPPTV